MSLSASSAELAFRHLGIAPGAAHSSPGQPALLVELQASQAREQALIGEIRELLGRQTLQTRELNHRLFNGLQAIASLLTSQSRSAEPEAAAALTVAVSRILAFGQVHRKLNQLDGRDGVEFRSYLTNLCSDLTELFLPQSDRAIAVEGTTFEIPSAVAMPLAYAVNELVTNSVKYGEGRITVRLEQPSPDMLSVSVSDQGPGLDADQSDGNGLGMKIVQSLIRQIAGEFVISDVDGRRCCFAIRFPAPGAVAPIQPENPPVESDDRPSPGRDAPAECSEAVRLWIMRANIDRYSLMLTTEIDPGRRSILSGLLQAEQAKQAVTQAVPANQG